VTLYQVSSKVLKQNPPKQGLKQKNGFRSFARLLVLKQNPPKQGLKQQVSGLVWLGQGCFKAKSTKTRIETWKKNYDLADEDVF